MFLSFGTTQPDSGLFVIGVIQGVKAYALQRYMDSEDTSNTYTIEGVPIITFSGTQVANSDNVTGRWHRGSITITRTVTPGWSWNNSTTMMPPRASQSSFSFTMAFSTRPLFRCLGFGHEMSPILELQTSTPAGNNHVLEVQLVNISPTNIQASPINLVKPSKRRRPPSPGPSKRHA